MTMPNMEWAEQEAQELRNSGTAMQLNVLSSPQVPRSVVNGKLMVNLCSNNYLGLTTHPRMKAAAAEALERFGVGTGSVRSIAGTMALHEELEQKLATFKHTEAALVFQSGFACNSGAIPVMTDDGDVIITDELNHASIIDGIRLSKASRRIFPHADMNALEDGLRESSNARRRLIVTDGVFSMDGDVAKLPEIVDLAERYHAMVYVDDAHASGVFGKNGRGTVNHFGLDGRVHVQVGTLSKAVGVLGGYVASTRGLKELLINRGRPFIFSTSHPPAVTAACIAAIDVLESEPELIDRLWDNTKFFKKRMLDAGFDIGNSESPITPIIAGEDRKAGEISSVLFREGVFAPGIAFPTVARNRSRVRTIVTAAHTREDLEEAIRAFETAGEELGLIKKPATSNVT
jgi:glycine C-acetyltransferase